MFLYEHRLTHVYTHVFVMNDSMLLLRPIPDFFELALEEHAPPLAMASFRPEFLKCIRSPCDNGAEMNYFDNAMQGVSLVEDMCQMVYDKGYPALDIAWRFSNAKMFSTLLRMYGHDLNGQYTR